ncbi:polysaccharide deacetylase family protein [Teichococcus aestuarii]|uniref:hypothetical protein n=1 Tax=Teichococcus aestuarii TaxID=568898 RepID=UPI0036178471
MLPSHGRYDYHPWRGRPAYAWPGERRLAVYLGLNLEHFAFGQGLGAELAPGPNGGGGPQPDVLNYAWRDYGNRVGAWRMLDMLDELSLPATVLLNSAMYDYAPSSSPPTARGATRSPAMAAPTASGRTPWARPPRRC